MARSTAFLDQFQANNNVDKTSSEETHDNSTAEAGIARQAEDDEIQEPADEQSYNEVTGNDATLVAYGGKEMFFGDPPVKKSDLYFIPVVGPALESGDQLVSGDYLGAVISFGVALGELFTFGAAAEVRTTIALSEATIAKEVVKDGSKLYSEATFKSFERQLANDGMNSVLKTQSKIQKKLTEHIQKLVEIKKTGGYSSSVEREIRTFQSQLNAIKDLLK